MCKFYIKVLSVKFLTYCSVIPFRISEFTFPEITNITKKNVSIFQSTKIPFTCQVYIDELRNNDKEEKSSKNLHSSTKDTLISYTQGAPKTIKCDMQL